MASPRQRLWQAFSGDASLTLDIDSATLSGNKNTLIKVGPKNIAFIGEEIHMNVGIQRRKSLIMREMDDIIQMIPSTLLTPLPPHIPFPLVGLELVALGAFVALLVKELA